MRLGFGVWGRVSAAKGSGLTAYAYIGVCEGSRVCGVGAWVLEVGFGGLVPATNCCIPFAGIVRLLLPYRFTGFCDFGFCKTGLVLIGIDDFG